MQGSRVRAGRVGALSDSRLVGGSERRLQAPGSVRSRGPEEQDLAGGSVVDVVVVAVFLGAAGDVLEGPIVQLWLGLDALVLAGHILVRHLNGSFLSPSPP